MLTPVLHLLGGLPCSLLAEPHWMFGYCFYMALFVAPNQGRFGGYVVIRKTRKKSETIVFLHCTIGSTGLQSKERKKKVGFKIVLASRLKALSGYHHREIIPKQNTVVFLSGANREHNLGKPSSKSEFLELCARNEKAAWQNRPGSLYTESP